MAKQSLTDVLVWECLTDKGLVRQHIGYTYSNEPKELSYSLLAEYKIHKFILKGNKFNFSAIVDFDCQQILLSYFENGKNIITCYPFTSDKLVFYRNCSSDVGFNNPIITEYIFGCDEVETHVKVRDVNGNYLNPVVIESHYLSDKETKDIIKLCW